MELSIIIVTWNCRKFVLDCLSALERDVKPEATEIIVVDNASSDGTPESIAEQFPYVALIRSTDNLGFAKANNLGIQRARGERICLLNPDVEVITPCLGALIEFLDTQPDAGLVGPVMLNAQGRQSRSYMRYPSLWNAFCRAFALDMVLARIPGFGGQLMTDFRGNYTRNVDVLNGWFWLGRRRALQDVGLLDEQFFMYGEDIDWCRRFHQAGWRVMFFAGASASHYGGACSANEPIRFSVEMERANLQYWEKYHPPLARKFYVALCGAHHLIRCAAYCCLALLPSHREKATAKARRSLQCLRWLAFLKPGDRSGVQSQTHCQA